MKKLTLILILFFGSINILNADINRIIAGNKNAKITIIAYESLTCSHCADFHRDIYPQLKKDYIDTGFSQN
ncbi:MAG: thioredoxin domain-containing protein [Candidatus Pelagibacter sp.]